MLAMRVITKGDLKEIIEKVYGDKKDYENIGAAFTMESDGEKQIVMMFNRDIFEE